MAVEVQLKNDGPPISGELRIAGGTQGQTRFGLAADLPTQSDKTFRIYTQPPAFGRDVEVSLVDGASVIAKTKATFTLHDPTQLVVGIVAERPGAIVGSLDLLPNANNVAPLACPSTRRTCRIASRRGARSIGSCGRTSTRRAFQGAARGAERLARRRRPARGVIAVAQAGPARPCPPSPIS
jgi:hypothetical protein